MEDFSKQTLDSLLYQRSLIALSENLRSVSYALVGGMSVQIYSSLFDKKIPLRPTNDFDISVANLDFTSFSRDYGNDIARFMKNRFGYGYHLRRDHFANTVHVFENKDKDNTYVLLHFNRYQQELYEKIKEDILRDLMENANDVEIDSSLRISILSAERIKHFKKDRISKKSEIFRLDSNYGEYSIRVLEDIRNENSLSYVDLNKLFLETISAISKPKGGYDLKKDIYDYSVLSQISFPKQQTNH